MTIPITREETLLQAAKKLDIPPSKYKEARTRFRAMDNYLSDGNYAGATPPPDIYLQGSFKLGTEIRPYKNSNDADYDIDMVCCLNYQTENPTPKRIKDSVGDCLTLSYHNMLEPEGKRCWTVKYTETDSIGFHIDIVPSIPETSRDHSIAITNKDRNGNYEWSTSNPKGFAEWFYIQNGVAFQRAKSDQKRAIFEANVQDGLFLNKDGIRNIDEVPNIHVKTPLQRAIQLLKRHRDVRFSNQTIHDEKCKPISMIITVLAAQVYQGENTIYATLQNLITALSQHANQMQAHFVFNSDRATSMYRLITKRADGTWYIPNPANDGENFADKWHETKNGVTDARAKAFFDWVRWAQEDFINIHEMVSVNDNRLAMLLSGKSANGTAVAQPRAAMFDVPHKQPPPWQISKNYNVQVSGKFKARHSLTWQRFNSNDLLEKNCDLKFLGETNTPKPFDVYWQVVNTGQDAIDDDGLRGGFIESTTAGSGGLRHVESLNRNEFTRYAGTHWIQCFIVKNNVCVAYSDEFLVRIR